MLLGKLYAMLIYGMEGSKGKILALHWTFFLNMLVLACFAGFCFLFFEDTWTNVGYALLALAMFILPVVIMVLLCRWGRKKSKMERESQN